MITIGQRLPEFSGTALMPNGKIEPLALADYQGQWLVLFFWPLDFTFVCPTEVRGYDQYHRTFSELNCRVLGASVDRVYAHHAWVEKDLGKVHFPLIGDVTRKLASGLGVLLEEEGVATRATFIVNPEGVIESISVNSLNAGRSVKETLRILTALQSGELTACDWQPGDAFIKAA